ncbi:hypothetical protein AB0C18_22705 [Nonomuraea muscovyensis]|uniref:hypothetical protein n=1 Tax=Nonomuraea muscovyensis TaxID=1124761 RepID=UPI0033D863A5
MTFPTPPFAEHSTFSSSAAEVLRRFTGGIHFRAGDLEGRAVGAAAWDRARAYWSGAS